MKIISQKTGTVYSFGVLPSTVIIIITFTWSGPSGVIGCTGQRSVGPAAGWCLP
jgi:hypothetical protein